MQKSRRLNGRFFLLGKPAVQVVVAQQISTNHYYTPPTSPLKWLLNGSSRATCDAWPGRAIKH
jgi:hypothetical protein